MGLTSDGAHAYHTSPMTATFRLRAGIAWHVMSLLAVLFAGLGLGGDLLGSTSTSEFIWPVLRQFDFVEEGNLVNWYQSGTLLFCGVLAWIVATASGETTRRDRWPWIGIALVFLFLSADESAQLHETTLAPFLQDAAAAGDAQVGTAMKKAYWMLPYLLVLLGLAAAYARFLRDLRPATRSGLILAAVLFLSGAVGAELMTNWLSDQLGGQSVAYQLINNGSELLEMLGVAVCARALLRHLTSLTPRIEWSIETD